MFTSRILRTTLALAFALSSLAPAVRAQDLSLHTVEGHKDFDLYQRGPYRDGVPRPESLLGYKLGDRETTYWQQDRVINAIADSAKDRARVIRYGESVEGRPLRVVVFSAPENIARIDEIRASSARLADPRGLAESEERNLSSEVPVIVWINENIHGDESTSFETAMATAYTLAASEDPRVVEALRNCVVVLNPSFNPDGHERFAVYHNSIGTNDPNNDAFEHEQPWAVYGRFNHYRFDMNRDKLAVSQQEVRQEIAEYLKWNPQVYADQHGETEQYFFPPVAQAINQNTDEAMQEKWLNIFGKGNSAAFDQHGWDYFTRKTYDLFYVGYLDAWATLNGATGMTYETDGGGNRGFAWGRDDGSVITLRDGIAHHFVTAMATIETASANREARLHDFVAFRRASIEEGKTGAMRRVVIVPGRDGVRAAQLVSTLRRVGVEVGIARDGFASRASHAFAGGAAESRNFTGGVYVVDLAQPQGRLARAFLEPDPTFTPAFVKDQVDKARRNQARGKATSSEDYDFYDVTAWSLGLTSGADAYWTEDAAPVAVDAVGVPAEPDGALRPPFAPEGRVTGGRGTQAYLFPYDTDGAPRLALQLLREGFKIAVSPEPLKAGGRSFGRGTIVVRTQRNPETLAARMAVLARQTGVEVTAVDSQWSDESTVGVGSSEVATLETPRICVAAGDPVATTSFGSVWFMFERELRYPFTAMNVSTMARTDLSKFNVIILPDGSAGDYADALGKRGLERLKSWVKEGGTLVGLGGASAFLTDKDVALTSARPLTGDDEAGDDAAKDAVKPKAGAAEGEEEGETGGAKPATPTARKRAARAAMKKPAEPAPEGATDSTDLKPTEPIAVPGAIFRATVDPKYFMSFGYDAATMPVPVNSDFFLKPSKEGANVLTFVGDKTRVAGFIWPGNTEPLLKGAAYLVDEPTGRGHVILFTEDVTFRRLWHSLDRLFVNSILFAPTL